MTLEQTVRRVHAEFMEMPGLLLSRRQAERLWNLDPATCDAVIASLLASGFLRQTAVGAFRRTDW